MTKKRLKKIMITRFHFSSRRLDRRTRTDLRSLDGLLQLLLQAADQAGQALDGTGRYLHRQLEILTDHVARLATEHLQGEQDR